MTAAGQEETCGRVAEHSAGWLGNKGVQRTGDSVGFFLFMCLAPVPRRSRLALESNRGSPRPGGLVSLSCELCRRKEPVLVQGGRVTSS